MIDDNEVDPQRITRGMRDRIEALESAADYIDVLVEIAMKEAVEMEQALLAVDSVPYRNWQIIKAVLHLAIEQADIIKSASTDFRVTKLSFVA